MSWDKHVIWTDKQTRELDKYPSVYFAAVRPRQGLSLYRSFCFGLSRFLELQFPQRSKFLRTGAFVLPFLFDSVPLFYRVSGSLSGHDFTATRLKRLCSLMFVVNFTKRVNISYRFSCAVAVSAAPAMPCPATVTTSSSPSSLASCLRRTSPSAWPPGVSTTLVCSCRVSEEIEVYVCTDTHLLLCSVLLVLSTLTSGGTQ